MGLDNVRILKIEKKINAKNNEIADNIRRLRKKLGIPMVDIMGSVGSGKTSILEYYAKKYHGKKKLLVINGDLATDIDAQRIAKYGGTCLQINTGRGCHLKAFQVEEALKQVNLKDYDFIFVENVGNIICPSSNDVGADFKIVVTSVTEGPYVFEKHPISFKMSKIAVINKTDLANAMEINIEELIKKANSLYPGMPIVPTSTKTGEGMDKLAELIGLK